LLVHSHVVACDGVIDDVSVANLKPLDVRDVDSPARGRNVNEKPSVQGQMILSALENASALASAMSPNSAVQGGLSRGR
jgi:hypothetical protein